MARITIVIEDKPNGNVSMTATPPFSQLAQKAFQDDSRLTSAEGYALKCYNSVRDASKAQKPKHIITLPRIRGT